MRPRAGSREMEQIQPHREYNRSSLQHKQQCSAASSPLAATPSPRSEWAPPPLLDVLPCVDEVLGDTDAGRRARDRDLACG